MLVVTAGSDKYDYATTMRYCEGECEKRGYGFRAYDLGGLGFGIEYDDVRCTSTFRRVKSAMKPELILDTLYNTDDDVAWIDGDATIIDDIHEVFDSSFDVGITVRPKRQNKKTHYINAGVLFFKNNIESRLFLEDWIDAMGPVPDFHKMTVRPEGYSDQTILEEKILLPNIQGALWDQFGSVHTVHGARVKILECETYNNYWLWRQAHYGPPNGTRVLHFKAHKMNRILSYAKDFL
jgi:hypothetical protein